ncbi:CbrC family protein [Flavobacterium sp. HNIBRBA15423]|uniref:CbrC family protein n=1 Tax=Flavobacterium sp. HNIBRBA15423 TaxID=3458683 RepID=UPI0040451049
MSNLDLKYIRIPFDQIPFELNSENTCFFCGKQDSPQLHDAYTIIAQDSENAESVCLKCLLEKKYAIEHKVEGGFLKKEGILLESEKDPDIKNSYCYAEYILPIEKQLMAIDESKRQELMHTPPFSTFHGAVWLIHCNDFMTYIGNWEHEDFVEKSPNGNAQEYFDRILDNYNGDDFYEEQFSPNKLEYAESLFYAFECQHCKIHRGYVE